jgi:site-specific recombinase XerD
MGPATLPHIRPAATTHTLRDTFDSWRDSNPDRPRKTVDAYAAAVDRFDALMPGRHVDSFGRADGLTLVAALKRWADAEGKSRTTASKILGQVKTLLAHAHNVEWIARNPLQGQSIEKAESDREPWSDDD